MVRLLIVDDAAFMRTCIRKIASSHDIEVVGEAGNALDALEKYKMLKPDLVTMDITMPEADGIEGVKLIKDYDANAKIIMVTALGQENKIRESIKSGAVGFVLKPFKEEKLLSEINAVCNKK